MDVQKTLECRAWVVVGETRPEPASEELQWLLRAARSSVVLLRFDDSLPMVESFAQRRRGRGRGCGRRGRGRERSCLKLTPPPRAVNQPSASASARALGNVLLRLEPTSGSEASALRLPFLL